MNLPALRGPRAIRESLRPHPLFLIATAVVAVHLVDDNFLQPANGTSASDHLVSGLVPLGILAIGAWRYSKVRAGARALIALATGLFAVIVGGFEAGYYTYEVGPTGDDYSGLLALPAGLLLLGVGVVELWGSRRHTPNPWWRYSRRVVLGVVGAGALYQFFLPVGVAYLATHAAHAKVPAPDLGAAHEEVTLRTSDGLSLEGWYVPSRNGAAVIVFAGRTSTQNEARLLVEHGYGVLIFDRRGEGASDGDGNMFGWGGERDIFAALDFLAERPDVDPERIGGLGLSVGGELMLQAAAADDRLAAVVTEGAGTRTLAEELEEYDGAQLALGLPLLAVKSAAVAVFSNTAPPPKLTDVIPSIAPRPTLFIWASTLSQVERMNPTYHRLAGPQASIWELDDAPHVRALETHPEEYERRVIGFFDETLSGPRR
jgi:hypothetical protein